METNSINSFLVLITGDIDSFMYTYILVALLVFTGIYFTIRTKGVQFRYIKDMFTQLFEKKVDKNGKAISSFQAMMVSTGSRVGTGNIAGIATALAMGGPGALFWMWVMALIGGASAFIESTLAQIFKIRGKDGQFRGGPAYYIQQGLGKRWMGIVFAVSLIACYVVGFNELQAYNAASGLEYYIPDYATNGAAVVLGVVFTIATAAVIFGGQKRISVINSWVVPIMALAYIGLGVWITFSHLNLLPAAFGMMFASAFDFQAIFGGFAGSALMLGIKRGLFSNEAGMGSAPNAAATASVSHPAKQGLVQTLSVYIDTLFDLGSFFLRCAIDENLDLGSFAQLVFAWRSGGRSSLNRRFGRFLRCLFDGALGHVLLVRKRLACSFVRSGLGRLLCGLRGFGFLRLGRFCGFNRLRRCRRSNGRGFRC